MKLRKFNSTHYPEYLSWFKHESIRNALYGIDMEWLDHVLKDEKGIEYAVFESKQMVGVVGITFPTRENPFYVITNIAVNPECLGRGIGARILDKLLNHHIVKENEVWLAFVDVKNNVAQRFFTKNGWHARGTEDSMIQFQYGG